jgi:hypothetical protein
VSSDQFNEGFFSTTGNGMDHMGFDWQNPPPAIMGMTSSFGQPEPLLSTNDFSSLGFADMSIPLGMTSNRLPSTTSADVLEAATLLQNGHNRQAGTIYTTQDLQMTMASHHSSQTPQFMTYSEPRLRPTTIKHDDFEDTYYTEMMFGPLAANGRPPHKGPPKDADIHFGSDAGFGSGQGFIAPPGQESPETIEAKLRQVVECIESKGSATTSAGPNSPVAMRYLEAPRRYGEQPLNGQGHGEDEDDSRPRKRRKHKVKEEDEEDEEDDSLAAKVPRKRKPKFNAPPSSSRTTQSPPPSKRRKSGASSASKPHRENLTEDQKRENHIKSEQKRRTLIKEGFEDLNELVPDLRGGGHSKSVVLVMAADWLEDLIKGNQVLRARLQELEEGTDNNNI